MTDRSLIISLARTTAGATGPEPWAREAGWRIAASDRPSWCALWYSAILRRAGLHTPGWVMGKSILTATMPRIPRLERAQPGDLGYVTRGGHHAMVVHDDGDTITSIDGNGPGGVVVVDRKRPRTDYAGFYSIAGLLHETADTDPAPAPEEPSVLLGVDVSAYQAPADMNWRRLRELGFSFMYARGVKMGREIDPTAAEHVARAREEMFSVGLYAFFDPRHDASKQFDLMVDAHTTANVLPGDLAPVLDIESINGGPQASAEWVTQTAAILDSYRHHWGTAVRYHNVRDWILMGKPDALEPFPLWLADYTPPADLPCTIWQCKSAPIAGYGTRTLDQNVAHGELPRIGHPLEKAVQAPPLFDLRSTPQSRWSARDEYMRRQQS